MLSIIALAVPAPVTATAGADQISSLQAQAAQIARTLVLEQLQVGAFQQQEQVASTKVALDDAAIGRTQQQLTADQQRIDHDSGAVRAQALRDYMSDGSTTTDAEAQLFSGGGAGALAQTEYEGIASGNITNEIDALRTSHLRLQAEEASLQQQQAADQAAQSQQESDLHQADATQGQLTAEQSQVTGQLTAAVAQQQAAAAAAAAAAVRASEAAAAKKATPQSSSSSQSSSGASGSSSAGSTGGTPPPASGAGGATSDPPLPPFLICVRQVESGGDYGAVSPNGDYMGAFQFSQSTWNAAADDAGLPGLVGVPPNTASRADQDTLAVTLYNVDGEQPWLDSCNTSS